MIPGKLTHNSAGNTSAAPRGLGNAGPRRAERGAVSDAPGQRGKRTGSDTPDQARPGSGAGATSMHTRPERESAFSQVRLRKSKSQPSLETDKKKGVNPTSPALFQPVIQGLWSRAAAAAGPRCPADP